MLLFKLSLCFCLLLCPLTQALKLELLEMLHTSLTPKPSSHSQSLQQLEYKLRCLQDLRQQRANDCARIQRDLLQAQNE